jgi:septum formation protein
LSDPVPQHFWERVLPDRPGELSIGFSGLVLASRSPQRKLLLEQLGLPFRIVVSKHDEGVSDGNPAHTVQQNARGKAEEVMAREAIGAGELVLGVDTVVVCEGEILGKARDAAEAAAFVRRLAARRHEVYSGLYLTSRKVALATHTVTGVTFRSLTDADLGAYISSGEWRDRAGAYAIQGIGSGLVRHVDGDYFNVVGLPVAELIRLLASFGVAPFSWLPGRV